MSGKARFTPARSQRASGLGIEAQRANMHLAWSAAKDEKLCYRHHEGVASPYTAGFVKAFADGKAPAVEEAHKSAAAVEKIKAFKPGYISGDPNPVSVK